MQLLQPCQPYKSTAQDFSSVHPFISFYLYKYYLIYTLNIYKANNDPYQKSELEKQIKSIEKQMLKMKNQAKQEKINQNQEQDMKKLLEYVEAAFAKNDYYYRNQKQMSQQLAEDFLTLSRLYEVINKFGKLDQGQNKRRLYSKKKYIQLMKQIKLKKSVQQSQQNQPPKKQQVPLPPQSNLSIQQLNKSILKSGFKPQLPKPSQTISYDKITMQMQATKCLQYAVSQLSFDRYKYAKQQVLKALELLDSLDE